MTPKKLLRLKTWCAQSEHIYNNSQRLKLTNLPVYSPQYMEVRKTRDIRKCRYAAFKVCLVAFRRDQEKRVTGFVWRLNTPLEHSRASRINDFL